MRVASFLICAAYWRWLLPLKTYSDAKYNEGERYESRRMIPISYKV